MNSRWLRQLSQYISRYVTQLLRGVNIIKNKGGVTYVSSKGIWKTQKF